MTITISEDHPLALMRGTLPSSNNNGLIVNVSDVPGATTAGALDYLNTTKQKKISASPQLTLTIAGWVDKIQTVSVTLNTSYRNEIDVVAASVKDWATAQVLATAETETGITFTCETIPTVGLEFRVTSTEVDYVS